ncbi:hypothetical protein GWN42_19130 [candidate division KSB1 bacterium]|nr:hypothetical protein [candidate division KSB1 bacterium]
MKKVICSFVIIMLFACSDDNPIGSVDQNFVYPLKIGNAWNYSLEFSVFNFRPRMPGVQSPETTVRLTSDIEIVRTAILEDTVEAFVFNAALIEGKQPPLEAESFYQNRENGLFLHRVSQVQGNVPLPKLTAPYRIHFLGQYFDSLTEIRDFLGTQNVMPGLRPFDPTNAQLILSYPLEVGKQWQVDIAGKIQKQVVGIETVTVPAGKFECFKIQWLFDGQSNAQIEFFDFISAQGLIKRTTVFKDMALTSEDGPDVLGFFDTKQEAVLKSFRVE